MFSLRSTTSSPREPFPPCKGGGQRVVAAYSMRAHALRRVRDGGGRSAYHEPSPQALPPLAKGGPGGVVATIACARMLRGQGGGGGRIACARKLRGSGARPSRARKLQPRTSPPHPKRPPFLRRSSVLKHFQALTQRLICTLLHKMHCKRNPVLDDRLGGRQADAQVA